MDRSMKNLNEALDLTRRMLAQAREGEWERVQWLENRRQLVLRKAFDGNAMPPSPEEVYRLLHRIMEVDLQVADLVASARDDTVQVLRDLGRGREAARAYRQAGG